jgi:hypothetical protein
MSKVIIDRRYLVELSETDVRIRELNTKKIRLLLEALGACVGEKEFMLMTEWDLILVAVPDRQMAVQLNKLCAYVPNLKFVAEPEKGLFEVMQGKRERRVWKER